MPPSLRSLLAPAAVLALVLLAGCRVIAAAILIPVAIVAVVFGGIAGIFVSGDRAAVEAELYAGGVRVEQRLLDVAVAEDLTFEGSLVDVRTVTSPLGLAATQQTSLSYDPRVQRLELVSAEVVDPDGEVLEVGPEHVFERPTAVERGAPGFVEGRTVSVLFPRLRVGSTTRITWRFSQSAPSALGFTYSWRPDFALPVDEARITVRHAAGAPVRFAADDAFTLEESMDGDARVVVATLRDYAGQSPERAMVAPRDVCPEFLVTTTERWEDLGAAFRDAVAPSAAVTPEIDALAAEIVGDRTGLDAARAIHRWVCANVQYVVVYMHPMDGWVPHPADQVFANRYGDCKDKVALLAALLAARGIEAEPVLVRLDRGFEPFALPTALQFDHCMAYLPEFDLYSNPTDAFRDLGELEVALCDKFTVHAGAEPRVGRTPAGTPDGNAYRATHRAALGPDGLFRGESVLELDGRVAGQFRPVLAGAATADSVADGLLHAGALGGAAHLETTDPTDLDTPLRCAADWTSEVPIPVGDVVHFAAPAGVDFLNPALLLRFLTNAERRYPLLTMATDVRWRVELAPPPGYALEAPPEPRRLENGAGLYESVSVVADDGRLVIDRHLRVERDRFAPEEYGDLRALLLEALVDVETILTARLAPEMRMSGVAPAHGR